MFLGALCSSSCVHLSLHYFTKITWAMTTKCVCTQRRLRSAWHPPSLIRVFAQADLSLSCAHTHFVGFVMSRLTSHYIESKDRIHSVLSTPSSKLVSGGSFLEKKHSDTKSTYVQIFAKSQCLYVKTTIGDCNKSPLFGSKFNTVCHPNI